MKPSQIKKGRQYWLGWNLYTVEEKLGKWIIVSTNGVRHPMRLKGFAERALLNIEQEVCRAYWPS